MTTALTVAGDIDIAGSVLIFSTPALIFNATPGNVFVGNAGNLTASAGGLTGIGKGALAAATTADSCTAIGYLAMNTHTTGTGNVAIGDRALSSSTGSTDCTAVGSRALRSNIDGVGCTAVGTLSQASNVHGGNNTSVGDSSLFANTTGVGVTAVGYRALTSNVGGSQNSAFGAGALFTNVGGSDNTAIGHAAMESANGGSFNVALGSLTLTNTTGNDNVAVGYSTLINLGANSGNTALGTLAGASLTSGLRNTFVGYSAGNDPSQSATVNNSIAIGNSAFTTASNQAVFGPSTITQTILRGAITYGAGPSIITSPAAATLQLGAADAAAPVAQTLAAQSVVAGTTDGAGADLVIAGSRGTGTGFGGSLRFQVAPPAATTGSTQNALADAISISRTKETTFFENVYLPSNRSLFWTGRTGLLALTDGSLRVRNNAGTGFFDMHAPAAAVLQLGNGTTGAPVAQTIKTKPVAAGTTDTAGVNLTIQAGSGTGTGTGGSLVFQTAPAGGSGSTQNALATAMLISGAGSVSINKSAPDYQLDVNGIFGFAPGASATPVNNGDVVFELTNDTTFTIKAKGSDGVVRSAAITLS